MKRVLVLCIASRGAPYDDLKRVMRKHARAAPPGIDVRFVYGRGGDDDDVRDDEDDLDVVTDVAECLVPGVVRKTLQALRRLPGYDVVVRSNLSTFFHWARLAAFLRDAPTRGLAAGYSDFRSHLGGSCAVLSADVVRHLLDHETELGASALIDDEAMSRVIWRAFRPLWIPRLDAYPVHHLAGPLVLHAAGRDAAAAADAVFHVRVKSDPARFRHMDVALVAALASRYDPERDPATELPRAFAAALGGLPPPYLVIP